MIYHFPRAYEETLSLGGSRHKVALLDALQDERLGSTLTPTLQAKQLAGVDNMP